MNAQAVAYGSATAVGIVPIDQPFELVVEYQRSWQEHVAAIGKVGFGAHLQERFWPIVGEGLVVYQARHFVFPARALPADAAKQMFQFDEERPWLPAMAEHLLVDVAMLVRAKKTRITIAALWARLRLSAGEHLFTAQLGDGTPSFVIQQVSLDLMPSTWCLAVREQRRYAS